MLSHEHIKLLVQAVSIVLALHFAKGSMTGEYRNLIAVGLVVVVLVVVNHLLSEHEGAFYGDHGPITGLAPGVVRKLEEERVENAAKNKASRIMSCLYGQLGDGNYGKLKFLLKHKNGTEKLKEIERFLGNDLRYSKIYHKCLAKANLMEEAAKDSSGKQELYSKYYYLK
jgi:hypothetical protein